jgi:hypothetical protein
MATLADLHVQREQLRLEQEQKFIQLCNEEARMHRAARRFHAIACREAFLDSIDAAKHCIRCAWLSLKADWRLLQIWLET